MRRVFSVYYETSDSIFPCDRAPSLQSLRSLTARAAAWSCDKEVELDFVHLASRLESPQRQLGDRSVPAYRSGSAFSTPPNGSCGMVKAQPSWLPKKAANWV